jgi:hypothetical protein
MRGGSEEGSVFSILNLPLKGKRGLQSLNFLGCDPRLLVELNLDLGDKSADLPR